MLYHSRQRIYQSLFLCQDCFSIDFVLAPPSNELLMVCGKMITSLAEQRAQPIIRTCLRNSGKLCDDRPWCPNGITLCSNSLVFQLLKKIQQKTVRTTHNLPRYDKVKTLDKRQGFMTTILYAEQNKGCYKFLW